MPTIVIAGNDTGVGKTRVTAVLARELCQHGSVQVVKPVETGVRLGGRGDVEFVMGFNDKGIAGHTLMRFAEPMAPVAAAALEGIDLRSDDLLARYRELPVADWRLVEGAGGIASPMGSEGGDLRDFAQAIAADVIVLVVDDRLGAINQARMAHVYAAASGIPVVLWLNEVAPQLEHIRHSNREALISCGLTLCAVLSHEANEPEWLDQSWLKTQSV